MRRVPHHFEGFMRNTLLAIALVAVAPFAHALDFKPCDLPSKGSREVLQAECATLTVAENPAKPDGRKIDLAIARVKTKAGKPAPDPVFLLAGGPGQSALESYPQMTVAFSRIVDKRNVILVDQRGTGKSHALDCKLDAA